LTSYAVRLFQVTSGIVSVQSDILGLRIVGRLHLGLVVGDCGADQWRIQGEPEAPH